MSALRLNSFPQIVRQRFERFAALKNLSGGPQQFRNFFPNVVAQGTYGGARADMNETYSYGLQLNWTIFDGGGKIALYKQAQAQRDAAQARVRDTELTIWQQVDTRTISTTDTLVDVSMLDANNGYIVGWAGAMGAEIFKYDGTRWTIVYSDEHSLSRINASSPNNVWAAGLNHTAAFPKRLRQRAFVKRDVMCGIA